jgi:5-oxoprolinase (ATP-hydrolysing)
VTRAAVLYVFRVMVDDMIPMNAGCLRPIEIVIPEHSMLSPRYPAAVVAGNVEVSQAVTNCLFGAMQAMGASQGTMNNLTFGNDEYQYYETICSGSPPGRASRDGRRARAHDEFPPHRPRDPGTRFPVVLEDFHIREGSGGKGRWQRGRRHEPHDPVPQEHGMRHPRLPPPLRHRRRRAGRGGPDRMCAVSTGGSTSCRAATRRCWKRARR